jgi:hypothetical protein
MFESTTGRPATAGSTSQAPGDTPPSDLRPLGLLQDSTIGKTMGKPRYKSSTTTHNMRTLAKVLR